MTWQEPPELFDESNDPASFGIGLGHGFRHISPNPEKYRYTANNKYYYYPGYIIGYILKAAVLIAMANYGLGMAG